MNVGCIHGRFQPFHNGHMEYLKAAYAHSDRLIVGITQYDPLTMDKDSPAHRQNAAHNPFSYWQRAELIKAAISYEDISESKISIVPFPIHAPETIRCFVEPNCTMYTTIYERWNIEKIRRLKQQGFHVRVLWRRRHKQYEGRAVREAMRCDMSLFRTMVPEGVFRTLAEEGGWCATANPLAEIQAAAW